MSLKNYFQFISTLCKYSVLGFWFKNINLTIETLNLIVYFYNTQAEKKNLEKFPSEKTTKNSTFFSL